MFNNSEVKGAHFRILLEKVPIFAKNVRFLYYREANKKRHPPLKVAPMCAKAHVIKHSGLLSCCDQFLAEFLVCLLYQHTTREKLDPDVF